MAYTSLYRKYRPDTFDKVIGQDHIVRTLKNQIATDSVGHAYIFTGTRGTGKTSVAKIFARAVNCLTPLPDGSPCGKCAHCVELASPTNFDILEIDAASNNSVDQIRELTDKINFPPTIGRYKVYIVDEVHMLSKAAFNALLKTLEEPPAHAIFILATTEIHQIPATILSRCLRFDFRLVPSAVIAKRIRFIFDDIGVKYENEAVDLIAQAGAGSVRDALSVADMCVSYCAGNVTYDGVLEVLGAADPKKLQKLATAIADGNVDEALRDVAEFCDLGKSIPILAQDLATLFRNVLYIKNCSSAKTLLALPESIYVALKAMADKYTTEKCMGIMKIMSKLEGEFRYSAQHRILFESAVVLAASGGDSDAKAEELQLRVAKLEKIIAGLRKSGFESAPVKTDARQVWLRVASELRQSGFQLIALSTQDAELEMNDDTFFVKVADVATLGFLEDKNNRDAINKAFQSVDTTHKLVIEAVHRLDEDKALPYVKEMFGAMLEIK